MKIYISGPITGLDYEVAKQSFEDAERHVLGLGAEPVNPIKIQPETPGMTWAQYMAKDLPELLECDAIYMLDGWGHSRGARLERTIALELGLKMLYQDRS